MASSRGRSSRKSSEKMSSSISSQPSPSPSAGGLDAQQLLLVVPLVQRLGLVEALVALEADQAGAEHLGHRLGQLGLAGAGRALDQDRLAAAGRRGRRCRRCPRRRGSRPCGAAHAGRARNRTAPRRPGWWRRGRQRPMRRRSWSSREVTDPLDRPVNRVSDAPGTGLPCGHERSAGRQGPRRRTRCTGPVRRPRPGARTWARARRRRTQRRRQVHAAAPAVGRGHPGIGHRVTHPTRRDRGTVAPGDRASPG